MHIVKENNTIEFQASTLETGVSTPCLRKRCDKISIERKNNFEKKKNNFFKSQI